MRSLEDSLRAVGAATRPMPDPPSLADLQARVRSRRRRRSLTRASLLVVLGASSALIWATLLVPQDVPSVVAARPGPKAASNVCDSTGHVESLNLDDPIPLACMSLEHYGNHEPPAAVRVGTADAATVVDWLRQHGGDTTPAAGPAPSGTATILLVRTSGGTLTPSAHPDDDAIYAVRFGGSLMSSVSSGTGSWSELSTTSWGTALEDIQLP